MPNKYSPKEGGTTANFQMQNVALFSLLDSGNNEMCYFKGPGDRIEASRRPLGVLNLRARFKFTTTTPTPTPTTTTATTTTTTTTTGAISGS